MTFRTTLEAALADLKSKGIIKRDADILEPLGIKSKGTLSSYASGTIKLSDGFRTKFENKYHVKLDDYEHLLKGHKPHTEPNPATTIENMPDLIETIKANPQKQLLEIAVYNLSEGVRINAEANLINAKSDLMREENIRQMLEMMREGKEVPEHIKGPQPTTTEHSLDPNLAYPGKPGTSLPKKKTAQ